MHFLGQQTKKSASHMISRLLPYRLVAVSNPHIFENILNFGGKIDVFCFAPAMSVVHYLTFSIDHRRVSHDGAVWFVLLPMPLNPSSGSFPCSSLIIW